MKSKKAIEDGRKVGASKWGPWRDYPKGERRRDRVYSLASDQVVSLIAQHIRRVFGDEVENKHSEVYASRGYFFVKVNPPPRLGGKLGSGAAIKDPYWRTALKEGLNLRRYSLGLVFRALHGEILTD